MQRVWRLVLTGWLGLGVITQADAQQVCNGHGGQASSPTSRFVSEDDGTAVDQLTQLMWMRCPLNSN